MTLDPMVDFTELEAQAIRVKEAATTVLVAQTHLARVAVEHDRVHRSRKPHPRAVAWLAGFWGVSAYTINRWGRMAETFGEDVRPDVPLSVYAAVMETDDPAEWLERALNDGMSPRQVRDTAGIEKGQHLSSCKFAGDVEVTAWNPATGAVAVEGLPISGEKPARARVTVREILNSE